MDNPEENPLDSDVSSSTEESLPEIPFSLIYDAPMIGATNWRPLTPPTTDESNQAQPPPLLGTPPGRQRRPPQTVNDDGEEDKAERVWESFCWVFVPRERNDGGTVPRPRSEQV